jgi:hypothetical protein
VTEGVSENEITTCFNKLACRVIASRGFGNVGLKDHLILAKAKSCASSLSCIDEVLVIGGVLIVQEDEAYLEGIISLFARCERECDGKEHKNCENK